MLSLLAGRPLVEISPIESRKVKVLPTKLPKKILFVAVMEWGRVG